MQLGTFLLWVAMAATLIAAAAYIVAGRGKEQMVSLGRSAYYGMTTATVGISVYLMALILGNQFQYNYVSSYSSRNLELLYKISAFWAGQEGSFLLWALFGALIGLVLIRKAGSYESWLMAFWSLLQAFFFTLLLISSYRPTGPFAFRPDWVPGMQIDGNGLNPLLKNPWMAIHPPLVFLGYAAMAIPAAFVVTALIKRDYTTWANRCLPWTIFAWTSLGAGIFVGGYWAYEVLGWGGYWGWDPVENASLIPWLVGTALLHGMLVERSRATLRRTNMVLAILSFLLIIYATFLTRSGVLGDFSVHSFADLGVNGWLIAFLAGFTALCFGLYAWRAREIPGGPAFNNTNSKEFAFFLTLLVLSISAFMVFIGTSSPILSAWWIVIKHNFGHLLMLLGGVIHPLKNVGFRMYWESKGAKPFAAQPDFYIRFNTPVALALAALLSLAPVLAWSIRREGASSEGSTGRSRIVGAALLVAAAVAVIAGFVMLPKTGRFAPAAAAVALGLFSLVALSVNGMRLIEMRSDWKRIGGFLTHMGVSLMFIGIIFSNRGVTNTLLLPENGKPQLSHGFAFQYTGLQQSGPDKAHLKIKVTKDGHSFLAKPTMERTRDGMMRSPYIRVSPLSDLYIAPEELTVTGQTTVIPSIVIDQKGNRTSPTVTIPGTNVQLRLLGMQVEGRSATVEVKEPGKEPDTVDVREGSPISAAGRNLEFGGFTAPKGHGAAGASFGVKLSVTGPDSKTAARIKVGDKPLISVLWLGVILVLTGGIIAMIRRIGENRKILREAEPEEEELEGVAHAAATCAPEGEPSG